MQAPPAVKIDPRDLEFVDISETLSTDDPTQHRVVIAGGGAAGLELATWLGRRLGKRKAASITLVDRSRTHVWKPLLHEVASGSLDSEVDAIEFIPHAVKHGYRYRIGAMYGIDREKRGIYMAAAVYTSIVNRVLGKPPVKFRYQDFGSLVNLSEYGTFGSLFDRLSGRSVKVEGFMARTMYRSLYRMHLAAVHGPLKAGLAMLTASITHGSEARVKLH